jgi:hypothetical protein
MTGNTMTRELTSDELLMVAGGDKMESAHSRYEARAAVCAGRFLDHGSLGSCDNWGQLAWSLVQYVKCATGNDISDWMWPSGK